MDGVSGPGVGADATVMQDCSVGRMRLVVAALTCVAGGGELAHEGNKNERSVTVTMNDCFVVRILDY
jgi:hypothetical protein